LPRFFTGDLFGGFDFSSLSDIASLAVEATGTVLQQIQANRMLEMQAEKEAARAAN